ncbi:hypothetical protein AB0C18_04380 [Nonomuraea muscovyensis]
MAAAPGALPPVHLAVVVVAEGGVCRPREQRVQEVNQQTERQA